MFDRIGATRRPAQSRAGGLAAALFIHSLILAVALSMRQAPPPIEVVPLLLDGLAKGLEEHPCWHSGPGWLV